MNVYEVCVCGSVQELSPTFALSGATGSSLEGTSYVGPHPVQEEVRIPRSMDGIRRMPSLAQEMSSHFITHPIFVFRPPSFILDSSAQRQGQSSPSALTLQPWEFIPPVHLPIGTPTHKYDPWQCSAGFAGLSEPEPRQFPKTGAWSLA